MRTDHLLLIIIIPIIIGCRKPPETIEIVPLSQLVVDTVSIMTNPTGIAPLSAVISLQSVEPTSLTLTVLGDYPISFTSESVGSLHTLDLHGLYADHQNVISLELITDDNITIARDTLYIQTDTLSAVFPEIDITMKKEDKMEPGWNLIELNIGGQGYFRFHPTVFDPSGAVRWYLNLDFIQDWIGPFERLNNGNWLWAFHDRIYEYDHMGREINKWNIDGYWQHHDQVEMPNGNLIIAATKLGEDTRLDYIIELDRQSNSIVREWDLREVLDVDRFDLISNSSDWAHVNSVWYDEASDALIISARHQGVIKVDMENNLQWILAPDRGWDLAGTDGNGLNTREYLLTATNQDGIAYTSDIQTGAVDALDFSWLWGQHACMVIESGNLFCFDNGTNKNFNSNADYIRGVEYAIDDTNLTIQQVWEYGNERGSEIYSGNISDVDELSQTGNRLISPGNIPGQPNGQSRLIEVTYPEGEVVFEAVIKFANAVSTSTGWAQTDISYRAERLELYP